MNIAPCSFFTQWPSRVFWLLGLAILSFALTACGKTLSGTYQADFPPNVTVKFQGRKATFYIMGSEQGEFSYSIDGEYLKLMDKNGKTEKTDILKIQKDGSLVQQGGLGMVLRKQAR
ncbi:MAG: hypothetical protein FWD62_12145 [Betaproteobacteria bacterium]|nr:hypothetical protein [Betaproteobacteria bacterium]